MFLLFQLDSLFSILSFVGARSLLLLLERKRGTPKHLGPIWFENISKLKTQFSFLISYYSILKHISYLIIYFSQLSSTFVSFKFSGDISLFKVKFFMAGWSPHIVSERYSTSPCMFYLSFSFPFSLLLLHFPLKLSLLFLFIISYLSPTTTLSLQSTQLLASYHDHSTQPLH